MTNLFEEIIENNEESIVNEAPKEEAASEAPELPLRDIVLEEAIESILFAAGHPVTYATLARVFNSTPAKIRDQVYEYSVKYNDPTIPRGVILLTYNDSCQLCTKKYYLPEIREALGIRKSGTLSSSALETLAIVAYNQPVTRVFVDTLRRVDSSYAMNNLIDRGLIESTGRLDAPGRPMLYGTTPDFLRCFGLKSLDSLPATTEELLQVFENAKNAENGVAEQQKMDIPEIAEEIEALPDATQVEMTEIAEDALEPSADDDVVNDL